MRGSPISGWTRGETRTTCGLRVDSSFATSSIKPHQRSHRMSQTLDVDPCLARYTINTGLFSSGCCQPRACSKQDQAVCRPSLHSDLHVTLS